MSPPASPSSVLLGDTFRFAQSMLQASAVAMFWINKDLGLVEARRTGLTNAMRDEYFDHFHRYDPLHHHGLIARSERVAFLKRERERQASDARAIHADFMGRHGILDEVDFLLWDDDRPFALMCMMKRPCDPPFEAEHFQWETMRRHLQGVLRQHPQAREARCQDVLTRQFNLTTRELQVVELLQIGASNAKISAMMNITVPTVKTYVFSILNKLGVDSRFSAAAFVSAL